MKQSPIVINRTTLSDESFDRLIRMFHIKRYVRYDKIRLQDEDDTVLSYMVEGRAYQRKEDSSNHIFVSSVIEQGSFIGVNAFIAPDAQSRPKGHYIQATTACLIANITFKQLREVLCNQLLDIKDEILMAFSQQLVKHLSRVDTSMDELMYSRMDDQVMGTFERLAKLPGAMSHPSGTQIRISRTDVSNMIGGSREQVGKAFQNLHERGLIIESAGKTIVIR